MNTAWIAGNITLSRIEILYMGSQREGTTTSGRELAARRYYYFFFNAGFSADCIIARQTAQRRSRKKNAL